MINQDLEKRKLPDLFKFNNGNIVKTKEDWEKRKIEIKQILSSEEYGFFPKKHAPTTAKTIKEDNDYCGGNAIYREILLTMKLDEGEFSFPLKLSIPKQNQPCPAFIYISFHSEFPNKQLPVEEICDNGFAIISFAYEDITSDDDDFSNGLSKFFSKAEGKRNFGKILVWSWAAMHVMDYVQTLNEVDKENIAIVGLSRLGKTALLTGAFDERFKYTISNNSGQSGAAISRDKIGESIKDICDVFPFWFCDNYTKYSGAEHVQPFDQHYLLALVAPRNLYVASASEDTHADPDSEFLCCVAASPVYNLYNKKGFIHFDAFPAPNSKLHDGYIGYHLRKGCHYLSRYDWNRFMEYIKKHSQL